MRYKQEYEKMLDKYAKLLNFAYSIIADLKAIKETKELGMAREEQIQKIIKDN
jgi:hypothetical protein